MWPANSWISLRRSPTATFARLAASSDTELGRSTLGASPLSGSIERDTMASSRSASLRPTSLAGVPDRELLHALGALISRDRQVEADLLAHLGEVEARGLHLEQGFASMFAYCTEVLHFSEATAYHRIQAARAARTYPILLDRIHRGEIHLSGVKLLAPHLTPGNCVELLDRARHRSKRAIEEMLADRAPKPDASSFVRRLPSPGPLGPASLGASPSSPVAQVVSGTTSGSTSPHPEPLGQERFKIQFTASRTLREKLRRAQALLRHQIPEGDLAEIFDRALTLLIEDTRRKKFAETSRPARRQHPGRVGPASRHIPAEIKRAVVARDGERCAFVARNGRRCRSHDLLEFHH
jgi:hypothetical protein